MNLQERRAKEREEEEDRQDGIAKLDKIATFGVILVVLVVVIGFCSNASSMLDNNWDINNKHDFNSYLKWSERN